MKKKLIAAAAMALVSGALAMAQAKKMTADDYMEIQQLYSRYNMAIDMGDAEGWAACFTPDGVFQTFNGHDALVGFINTWKERMKGGNMRHWNSNLAITPSADGATGAVYLLLVDISAKPPAIQSASMYKDVLVKTANGWRFKNRQVKGDVPSSGPGAPAAKP
jgi:ketosteroid isomerase-like protein